MMGEPSKIGVDYIPMREPPLQTPAQIDAWRNWAVEGMCRGFLARGWVNCQICLLGQRNGEALTAIANLSPLLLFSGGSSQMERFVAGLAESISANASVVASDGLNIFQKQQDAILFLFETPAITRASFCRIDRDSSGPWLGEEELVDADISPLFSAALFPLNDECGLAHVRVEEALR